MTRECTESETAWFFTLAESEGQDPWADGKVGSQEAAGSVGASASQPSKTSIYFGGTEVAGKPMAWPWHITCVGALTNISKVCNLVN